MYSIYQVSSSDNLDSIAKRFQTSVDEIKKLNGITGNVSLHPGGFIIVPRQNRNEYLKTYVVKKGDNMYAIARDNGIDYNLLLELNGLDDKDYIYPDQEIIIPTKNIKLYKTKSGDTIKDIEQLTGTEIKKVATPSGEMYLQEEQIIMY